MTVASAESMRSVTVAVSDSSAASAVAPGTGVPERVTAVTWWPRASASATTFEPTMPVAPMTVMFMLPPLDRPICWADLCNARPTLILP